MMNRRVIWVLLSAMLMTGCGKKKKPSLSGEEPVEVTDFLEFFEPLNPPYAMGDTLLKRKEKDSLLISYKIFTQFVPDSVLGKIYGKNVKPKIYALGKIVVPRAETYLFVKTASADKRALLILGFDKDQQFRGAMTGLRPDNNPSTSQSMVLDKKYTITKTIQQRKPDGSAGEGKDVYVFNADAGGFMLIMTDPLNDKVTELINPIDTLPRKHKWSADYATGKMNLVSVRDGRKPDRISFFIHFEKNNGDCTGELKGEAMIRTPTTAEYREDGDPCVLKFIFSSTSVTLKEQEGCGSRRGLNCVFDGSFARKKYVKPAALKKSSGTNKPFNK